MNGQNCESELLCENKKNIQFIGHDLFLFSVSVLLLVHEQSV